MSEMARIAALSNFVNSQARNPEQRTADAFFVMMYGRELGIPAMTSLQQIYVIDGKPSCSGQMMLALAIKAGVDVVTPDPSSVKDKCEVKMRRPGKEWQTFTFTREMANAAGLLNRRNWKMYFANMMIWRTISMGLKIVAPDIIAGLYTIEEISPDTDVDESGAIIDMASLSGFTPPQAEETVTPAQSPTASQKTAQTGAGRDVEPVEYEFKWATQENFDALLQMINSDYNVHMEPKHFAQLVGLPSEATLEDWDKRFTSGKQAYAKATEEARKPGALTRIQDDLMAKSEQGLIDTTILSVHVGMTQNKSKLYRCKLSQLDDTLVLYTREQIRYAGWTVCEDWEEVGMVYDKFLPIPVKVDYNSSGNLELVMVQNAAPESALPK